MTEGHFFPQRSEANKIKWGMIRGWYFKIKQCLPQANYKYLILVMCSVSLKFLNIWLDIFTLYLLIDSVLSSYIYYFQVFIKQGNVALWYVFWFGIKNTQQTWLKVLFLPLLMNILFLYDIDYMSHHLWMCAVLYKISETTLKHILIPSNFKIAYYIF